jgi:antitoxin VapB
MSHARLTVPIPFRSAPHDQHRARLLTSSICSAQYTMVYGINREDGKMKRTAKVFKTNRSQAVRLPKEFQFDTPEVFIRKEGDEVILSPRPADWEDYLREGPVASDEFMIGVEDLPVQERDG